MHRTNIYLEERQTHALDETARREGVSRAEIIRRIIDDAVTDGGDRMAADLAAIDASFGSGLDVEVAQRGEDDRARHLRDVWRATP